MSSAFGHICGVCQSPLRIRTSHGEHIFLRTMFMQCTNVQCGATYRGFSETTHIYSPSALPLPPGFNLPSPGPQMWDEDRRALQSLENKNQLDLLENSAASADAQG